MSPKCRKRVESRGSVRTNLLWSQRGTDPASGHEAGKQGSFPRERREAADGSRSSKSALSSLHLQQQEILLIFFCFKPYPYLPPNGTEPSRRVGPREEHLSERGWRLPFGQQGTDTGATMVLQIQPQSGLFSPVAKTWLDPTDPRGQAKPKPTASILGLFRWDLASCGRRGSAGLWCLHSPPAVSSPQCQSLEDGRGTTWE